MEYILDANLLMSFLISGKARHKNLVRLFRFRTPEFVLVEVKKYEQLILSKTKLSEEELRAYSLEIFQELTILPEYFLSEEHSLKAAQMLEKVDTKDAPYLALSLQLDVALVTKDKALHEGLRKQGYRKILLFDDFLKKWNILE